MKAQPKWKIAPFIKSTVYKVSYKTQLVWILFSLIVLIHFYAFGYLAGFSEGLGQ